MFGRDPNPELRVRSAADGDAAWRQAVVRDRWGDEIVVIRGEVFRPHELPAFVAEDAGGERIGLASYLLREGEGEVVTLDSLREDRGVGSALLRAVADATRAAGCTRLRAVKTNDNLRALGFYQRRGLRLAGRRARAGGPGRPPPPSLSGTSWSWSWTCAVMRGRNRSRAVGASPRPRGASSPDPRSSSAVRSPSGTWRSSAG